MIAFQVLKDYTKFSEAEKRVSLFVGRRLEQAGTVHHARNLRHQVSAIKLLSKSTFLVPYQFSVLTDAVEFQACLTHPNILQCMRLLVNEEFYAVQYEFFSSQTLTEYINTHKPLACKVVKSIILQIGKAVSYMHQHQIVHRGLDTDCILINKELHVKVTGFTKAGRLGDQWKGLAAGAPPEGDFACAEPYKWDSWALGRVLSQLTEGVASRKHLELVRKLCEEKPELRISVSDFVRDAYFAEELQPAKHKATASVG